MSGSSVGSAELASLEGENRLQLGGDWTLVHYRALAARVAALADWLRAGGPCAQRAARELIAAVHGRPLGEATDEDTAQRIARQRATAEAREGIAAFLEKRPPGWLR